VELVIVITPGAGAVAVGRWGVGIPPILKLEIAYIFSVAGYVLGTEWTVLSYGND
jgi:hypothetical protein